MSMHDVTGLLKLFFRDMPEPLLTFDLYDPMVEEYGMLYLLSRK